MAPVRRAAHPLLLPRPPLAPCGRYGGDIASRRRASLGPPTSGFVPVRLEGYANGREFLGGAAVKPGSLPSGNPALVGGVPFVFASLNAEGKDHIDVGKSLYRHANLEGYFASYDHRWIGST